jgi:hypothetical protein
MDTIADYERGFRRAGLPLLIEDYSASEDIFNRAVPFLAFEFLVSVLGAVNLEWSALANVGALAGGLVLLLGTYGAVNLLLGRPFLSVPRSVGLPELAAFVLVPASLPLVFGGQVVSSAITALQQFVVLGVVYVVVGFGLLSIVRWVVVRLVRQLERSLRLLLRAIPLVLFFALVLFVNAEMWQIFSAMPRPFLAVAAGFFAVVGAAFLAARLPREVEALERESDAFGPPLRRSQRANVAMVMFVSQALQVLLVTLGVGLFFMLFGAVAVGRGVLEAWIGSPGHALFEVGLLGHPVRVTEELFRVSGAIAAFSGLYYAIAMLIDTTYRAEFLDEITKEMRQTFAARAEYLRLRGTPVRTHERG